MKLQRKDRELKHRAFQFKVKEVEDSGRFSGYASVFGVLDAYREIVAAGAFINSIKAITDSGRPLPCLWQHLSSAPIGGYDKLEEDEKGLFVEGFLLTEHIEKARETHALMKRGIVSGLSIGYYVIEDSFNEKDRVRTLKEVELVEVSVVTFPANPDARVDSLKSKLQRGDKVTIREFEQHLREQGWSRLEAEAIAKSGFKPVFGDSGESRQGTANQVDALRSLQLPTF
jgi:uncharacterized protein